MNIEKEYNRDDFLVFLKSFVPGFIKDVRSVGVSGLQVTKEIFYLGESVELGLTIFELTHSSSSDARVALAMDGFRVMKGSATYRALVIYRFEKGEDWRLSLMTASPVVSEKGKVGQLFSNPRRFSFFLGPNAKINTPYQFLIKQGAVKDFIDLQKRFSLEVVNKEFYSQIALLFTQLAGGKRTIGRKSIDAGSGLLNLPSTNDNTLDKEFTVRLIGRLVFCWFLKKKRSDKNIPLLPEELFSAKAVSENKGYYHGILEPLFFEVLNTPADNREKKYQNAPWTQIPFLNGGLFTPHHHDFYERGLSGISKYVNTLKVPDAWVKELFEIFETYNFTIDENTSVDVELSIEPEMLGRIFENLLAEINPETGETARKATGSYYTPRPIVEYMVDESLKQYLLTKTNLDEIKIKSLLTYEDLAVKLSESERESVLTALDAVKVIDPACGSGAFPMGILQKMLLILQKVDPESEWWLERKLSQIESKLLKKELGKKLKSENVNYVHKLGIIQGSIYGVDIQPIAVEISKLRFFLSLIVDEKINDAKENRGIEPLPNLEFKFVCTNSLIGLPKKDKNQHEFEIEDIQSINELKDLRDEYLRSYGIEKERIQIKFLKIQKKMVEFYWKHALKPQIDLCGNKREVKKQEEPEFTRMLSRWDPFSDEPAGWFDPEWMFGIKDGFDIVIANPPYVSHYSKQSQKLDGPIEFYLRENYEFLKEESKKIRINSVMFFLERGCILLKDYGVLTHIMDLNILEHPFKEIRKYVTKKMNILEIVKGLTVFENVGSGQIILILQKTKTIPNDIKIKNNLFCIRKTVSQDEILKIDGCPWDLSENKYILQKMEVHAANLSELVEIHTGVAVYATEEGKNLFIRGKKESKCHPLLTGAESVKFSYCECFFTKYLLFDKDLERQLNDRFDAQYYMDNGSHQRPFNLRKIEEYKRPKIILRQSDIKFTATYVEDFVFGNYSLFNIYNNANNIELLKYILALLNSKLLSYYGREKEIILVKPGKNPQIRSGQRGPIGIRQLPIKIVSLGKQKPFIDLVDCVLAAIKSDDYSINSMQQVNTRKWLHEIDQMVYGLYELTKEEIGIVENSGKSK